MSKSEVTRRQALLGLGATTALVGLGGCDRFDATSWVSRQRYDVDRRFRESTEELAAPLPPVLEDDERWSAFVFSDCHFYEEEINVSLDMVEDVLSQAPVDFLFQLGDLTDAGWSVEYETAVRRLERFGLPYFSALGNHDLFHDGWAQSRVFLGPSVYTMSIGAVSFIVMDLAGGTLGGLQRPWLEEELRRSRAEHIVAISHYPLWCPTGGGFSTLGSEQEIYDILNLFRRYGVEAHLSGHTHRWASTEVNGTKLMTVSAMAEGSGDRAGIRIDYDHGDLSFTRIAIGGDQ